MLFLIILINIFIVNKLVKRVIVKDVMNIVRLMSDNAISFTSNKEAPNIIGMARRNENLIEDSFFTPKIKPDPMVIPLLDIPGNNEKV